MFCVLAQITETCIECTSQLTDECRSEPSLLLSKECSDNPDNEITSGCYRMDSGKFIYVLFWK